SSRGEKFPSAQRLPGSPYGSYVFPICWVRDRITSVVLGSAWALDGDALAQFSNIHELSTTVMVTGRLAVRLSASCTSTVATYRPVVVGVPVISPVASSSVKPGASSPAITNHLYGGVPPVAFRTTEYSLPM